MPSCGRREHTLPADTATRSLVVGAASSDLRRELGPTSWMVLEEMLLRSTGAAHECIARVSVRALGTSLGLAKDTTARAIRRLRDAGLVIAAQQRTAVGVFDTGSYRIAIPEQIILVTSAPTAPHPNRRVARTDLSQLSFAIES
jgi:DNA-binding transcriptional ArsR family regulator